MKNRVFGAKFFQTRAHAYKFSRPYASFSLNCAIQRMSSWLSGMQPPGNFGFWRKQSLEQVFSSVCVCWKQVASGNAIARSDEFWRPKPLEQFFSSAFPGKARGIFPRSYTHRPNSWIGSGRGVSGAYLFLDFSTFGGVFFQIALTGLNRYLSNLSHKIDFFEVIYEYSIYIRIYHRCPKGVRGKNQQVHKCRIG